MSNNLGNLLVGFGLDLSALQKDAPEAFRILNQQTLGMTAEMKRASREGAESFRLIDEALGIHVSRPLTRILTQEFPAFGKALQSVLGGAVFGALTVAGVEAFDKVLKTIEKAQHAEEEFAQSGRKLSQVFAEAMGSYEKSAKLRSLDGLDKKIFEIDSSSLSEASKRVESLTEQMMKNSKAAEEASSPWNKFWAAIGDFSHQHFSLSSTLGVEEINKQMQQMREHLQDIAIASQADPMKGLHESLSTVQAELEKADAALKKMTADQVAAAAIELIDPESGVNFSSASAPSSKETTAQQAYVEQLKQLLTLLKAAQSDNTGSENEARKAEYAKEQLEAQEKIAALYKEMGSSLAKLQPETDPIKKLDTEISGFRSKAEEDFRAIGDSAASALATRAALAGLENYEKKLDELKIKLEGDILAKQAFELLSEKIPGGGTIFGKEPVGTAGAPAFSSTPIVPTLGGGGTAAAQFDVFSNDQAAQLKAAAAAYADALTPLDKYQLAQKELHLLLQKGLIDWDAYTAALQKASDQLVQGDDHLHKMQEDLQKLLERSESAADGVRAFFLQLQIEASENGKFAFAELNQGLKGFEDELAKAVFTGKAKWEDLFRSMAESAFKFTVNKEVSGLLDFAKGTSVGKKVLDLVNPGTNLFATPTGNLLTPSAIPGGSGTPIAPPLNPLNLPTNAFAKLPALLGGSGGGAASGAAGAAADTTFQSGATLLQTAATALAPAAPLFSTAATAFSTAAPVFGTAAAAFSTGAPILATAASELLAAAAKLSIGGIGGDGGGFADIPGVQTEAAGTDDFGGGLTWVGEQGPELLNLPGGSSITPAAAVRSGGTTHVWNIDATGNEDVGQRIVRAIAQATPVIEARAMAAVRELAKRTPAGR